MARTPENTKPETPTNSGVWMINDRKFTKNSEELIEASDPVWDYSAIWGEINEARLGIDRLLGEMAGVESASPENDRALMTKLEAINERVGKAIELLKNS